MRSDPLVTVTCDRCQDCEQVGLTALARNSYDERNLEGDLRRMGWTTNGDRDLCEECSEHQESA